MKPLDLNTLLYIIAAISLIFSIMMLLFSKITPTIKGPIYWSIGSFSAVLGAFLFAIYPVIPGYIAFVIAGVFATATLSFYLAGIQVYKSLRVNYTIFFGLILSQFFLGTIFYSIIPMPNVRMIMFSAISAIGSLLIVREFILPVAKPYRFAFILCAIAFSISALTAIYRIFSIVTLLPGEAHTPTNANLFFYFMTNITQAMLMFAFLLLISIKIAERLEKKVEVQRKFFSVIAHDLSGPVGTMTQILELANNDEDIASNRRNVIYREAEKLGESTYHLLQNLLFWSRNQLDGLKPEIKRIDLNKIILENIEILHHISATKGITITYEAQRELQCMGDERMIETIVRNLVSNAIKYTNSGGKVTISCEKAGKFMLVKIADNGVGMNEVVQNNLFKFNDSVTKIGTGGEKGTGLGLYLCKEFIEENNGSMVIQSQLNVGTEVVVSLPAE